MPEVKVHLKPLTIHCGQNSGGRELRAKSPAVEDVVTLPNSIIKPVPDGDGGRTAFPSGPRNGDDAEVAVD